MACDRRALKRDAKDAMHQMRMRPVVATIIFFVIEIVLNLIYNGVATIFGKAYWQVAPMLRYGVPIGRVYVSIFTGRGGAVILFVYIIIVLIGLLLTYGYSAVYSLRVARRDTEAGVKDFFVGFQRPGRIILAGILMAIFIYLWSLLLIFPGIIAAYRLRMTFYLMADHPELTCLEAMRQSRLLMKGFKWQAFVLDLSFLGWFLLGIVTCGVLFIYVSPYYSTTAAHFYFYVRNNQQVRAA